MVCAKLKPAVSGLEKEFPGRVKAFNVDAMTEEAKPIIQDAGFTNHGLIIRSPKGDILWKQADHKVQLEDVREALNGLVNTSS